MVNTIADSTDTPGSGVVSLRDAITTANASAIPTNITFSATVFATAQTIVLGGTQLLLSNATEPITITGPSAGVTISGNNTSAVFQMAAKVSASLSNLSVIDGSKGGITAGNGTLTLTNVTVSGNANWAEYAGGGISNTGTAMLTNVTVSANSNWGCPYCTGGIYNSGTMTLTGVTVSANSNWGTSSQSGGIYNSGTMTLTNDTVAGNTYWGDSGSVAGIYNAGTATLTNVTVAGNSNSASGGAGGIYNVNAAAAFTIANSIVAGNTNPSAPDVVDAVNSLGDNLIGNTTGSSGWVSTDLTGVSAGLGALANNGGPTQTMLPLTGSPAIDHGCNTLIPSGITTDQRGLPRIVHGTVDSGVVEVQASITVTGPSAQTATAGQSQSFTLGSFTQSQATAPFSVDVHWDDGSADTVIGNVPTAGTIPATAHTYSAVGTDTATITVSDSAADISNTATFTVTVSAASTTTVVTSNNSSPTYGQAVTFTASVTPSTGSGETGTVQFQIDGGNAGSPISLSGNTASYTTSTLCAGSHGIVAVYLGSSNFRTSTSPTLAQSVAKAATAATVALSTASPSYGQPVICTATLTPAGGGGATGTVQFQLDGVNIGSPVPLTGNTAAYATSMPNSGNHTVAAIYCDDGNYTGATSGSTTFTVNRAATTTTLAAPPAAITADGTSWVVATVTGVAGAPAPSSMPTYTYYSGTSATGTPLASSPTTAGTYTVLASYPGNGNYLPSSATATFTINAPVAMTTTMLVNGLISTGSIANTHRSQVTSLVVNFSAPATLAAGALVLTDQDASNPFGSAGASVPFALTASNGNTTYTLTFSGTGFVSRGSLPTSLPNGHYLLTLNFSKVSCATAAVPSGTQILEFHRLYGDLIDAGYVTTIVARADATASNWTSYETYLDNDGAAFTAGFDSADSAALLAAESFVTGTVEQNVWKLFNG